VQPSKTHSSIWVTPFGMVTLPTRLVQPLKAAVLKRVTLSGMVNAPVFFAGYCIK
jgi:hypothetical protein